MRPIELDQRAGLRGVDIIDRINVVHVIVKSYVSSDKLEGSSVKFFVAFNGAFVFVSYIGVCLAMFVLVLYAWSRSLNYRLV